MQQPVEVPTALGAPVNSPLRKWLPDTESNRVQPFRETHTVTNGVLQARSLTALTPFCKTEGGSYSVVGRQSALVAAACTAHSAALA